MGPIGLNPEGTMALACECSVDILFSGSMVLGPSARGPQPGALPGRNAHRWAMKCTDAIRITMMILRKWSSGWLESPLERQYAGEFFVSFVCFY
jgi:hypothetical protein